MIPTDEDLMAYADGELDEAGVARIEAAIRSDPELERKMEAQVNLRRLSLEAYPLPEMSPALAQLAATLAQDKPSASVSVLKPPRRMAWQPLLSAAACAAIGGFAVLLARPVPDGGVVMASQGALPVAAGALDTALTHMTSGSTHEGIHIAASFVAADGAVCRQFETSAYGRMGGIACRRNEGWTVTALVQLPPRSDGYAPAQESSAALAMAAAELGVARRIEGEEETEEIAAGWK
jgi:hypothetical protein